MSLTPSLKPDKDGEGSGLSPGLSTHLGSLLHISTFNLWRNTNYSSKAKNFIRAYIYARLTMCLQRAP